MEAIINEQFAQLREPASRDSDTAYCVFSASDFFSPMSVQNSEVGNSADPTARSTRGGSWDKPAVANSIVKGGFCRKQPFHLLGRYGQVGSASSAN